MDEALTPLIISNRIRWLERGYAFLQGDSANFIGYLNKLIASTSRIKYSANSIRNRSGDVHIPLDSQTNVTCSNIEVQN